MLYSAGLGLEGSFSAGVAAGGSGADDSALTDRSVTDLRMRFLDYTREPVGGLVPDGVLGENDEGPGDAITQCQSVWFLA